MAKEYVYEEIKANPALLQSTILADAVNEIENSTLGELISVSDTIPNDTIAIDSLQIVNQAITTNYLAEENFKIINELLLAAEDATFVGYDAAQLQTIMDIANQCPLEGGNAVYTARAILANFTGEVAEYENDCANYNGGNTRLTHNTSENKIPVEEKIISRIDYYDLRGRFILSVDSNIEKELNLLNGIYIAKSYAGDELISLEKVIMFK